MNENKVRSAMRNMTSEKGVVENVRHFKNEILKNKKFRKTGTFRKIIEKRDNVFNIMGNSFWY